MQKWLNYVYHSSYNQAQADLYVAKIMQVLYNS